MALPEQTTEDKTAALDAAKKARRERQNLVVKIREGELTVPDVLEMADYDRDGVVGKTKVQKVISSLPGFGPVRTSQVMSEVGIPETRRLRGLGPRQRQALLDATAA